MKTYLPVLLPVLATASSAYAENTTSVIETTLVTATRTEQTIENSLAPATVFTRDDIEKLQAKSLTELLSRVPGIEIASSGSKGSATSMYLRGTNDDHTLFLIDGQRFNSATLGSTSFQLVEPEQIERIEVVRGPRSSIYGSDAIGGVVQIFTKKGTTQPSHYIRTGAGSNDTWQIAGGSRGQIKGLRYSFNASHLETDGFDSFVETTPPNDDDDGYRNTATSINLGYDFSYGGKLDLNYFYTKSKNEYDDRFPPPSTKPYSEDWIQTANLTFSSPVREFWSTQVVLGHSIDDKDNLDDFDPTNHSHFRTTRESLLWQNDFQLSDKQLFTVGVDYYDDEVVSTSNYVNTQGEAVKSRDNQALFGVYQLTLGIIDAQFGLREDDNEDFGTETTANASVGIALDDNHKVIVSYGEGYKAPTFNDLYWPITPWAFGNPNLKAETSESYEIEFRGNYQNLRWSLNYYQTDISNLIDWAPVDPNDPFSAYTPSNVDNAEIEGTELLVITDIIGWQIAGTLQYITAEDAQTGKQLRNRPEAGAVLDIDRDFGKWQLGFGFEANSKAYGDIANNNETAGYGIFNARAGFQVTDEFKIQLKLNNLLEKDYQTRFDYNEDGLNGFVTFTYTL